MPCSFVGLIEFGEILRRPSSFFYMYYQRYLKQLPELTPAQLYDAFSFFYDHQEEIENELELNQEL
jgi:hypothetical protein